MKTWRDRFIPIIAAVIEANAGKPNAELRKALKDAFPLRPFAYHPYKIWLSEIRAQTKGKLRKIVDKEPAPLFDHAALVEAIQKGKRK